MAKILRWLFAPQMFAVGGVLCIGTGVAFAVTTDPKEISVALWFFGISAVWALGTVVQWLRTDRSLPLRKPYLALLLIGFTVAIWFVSTLWVVNKSHRIESASARPALVVRPEKISFRNVMEGYGSTYVFTVTNNSDSDLYSVVARLSIESSSVRRSDFDVSADAANRRVIYEGSDGAIYDPIILGITDDKSRFPGAWVSFYRIKAHESRDIVLRLAVTGDSAINVSSSILHFETTPQPLVADKGRVMYRILDKWIFVQSVPESK